MQWHGNISNLSEKTNGLAKSQAVENRKTPLW